MKLLGKLRFTRWVVCLGVIVSVAGSAFGVATAGAALGSRVWRVNGSLPTGPSSISSCETSTGLIIKAKVLGTEIEFHANGFKCPGGVIENSGGLGGGLATWSLSGVTVIKPALNCVIPGGSLVTNPLKMTLQEVAGDTHSFVKWAPASGSELITIPIEGCLIEGEYPINGSIAMEGNVWGTELVNQPFVFAPAVDGKTGDHLTMGGSAMTLRGTINFPLSSGLKFGGS